MKIRIDKMLSNMGIGSRKQIRQYAKAGLICVNGNVEKDSSKIIDESTDEVTYNGERIRYVQYIYLMMNKPAGVVSATEDSRERTVADLLNEADRLYSPFPAGRLDKDTEGLLLLTNNGMLAHNLLSPRKHVDKTYYTEIRGCVGSDDVSKFASGVMLEDGYVALPAGLSIIEQGDMSKCFVTISEGKFHQIKRMFEAVGKEVSYLKRLEMGPLRLDENLSAGEYRHLTEDEMSSLTEYM